MKLHEMTKVELMVLRRRDIWYVRVIVNGKTATAMCANEKEANEFKAKVETCLSQLPGAEKMSSWRLQ
jgi:hypothetical protein